MVESEDSAALPSPLEALELVLPRLAHNLNCMVCLPTSEWKERGSWVVDKCCCVIATVEAVIRKAKGETL